MRFKIVIILFLSFSFTYAQVKSNDKFLQEIATVYTTADGLPEAVYSEIRIDESKNILVVTDDKEYIYKNNKWELLKNTKSNSKKEKTVDNNEVLTKVEYQGKSYIGKKSGLFIQSSSGSKLTEIFPADKNYSWKLSNVTVLIVDTNDRLWFGSN